MVALRGQVSLDLTGKVSIPGGKRLATRFDTIPDAPITKFTLRIVSGKNGPVGIATNLCSAKGEGRAGDGRVPRPEQPPRPGPPARAHQRLPEGRQGEKPGRSP